MRIIAATNKQPGSAVAEGKFREDLYHRLNVFPIHLPPLRERGSDLEMLAQHFLDQLNATENSAKRFAASATASLYEHAWPGNVRELESYVQRAYLLADAVIDGGAQSEAASHSADEEDEITVKIGTPLNQIEARHDGRSRAAGTSETDRRDSRDQPEDAVQPARRVFNQ